MASRRLLDQTDQYEGNFFTDSSPNCVFRVILKLERPRYGNKTYKPDWLSSIGFSLIFCKICSFKASALEILNPGILTLLP